MQENVEIEEVARIIKNGGIVVFPTETVYGIGVNGLDEKAVEKLYRVKQRDLSKPVSLLVSSMEMVENLARDITKLERKIMEAFFSGPLTIILKKSDSVPDIVTANGDTVGIRMPDNEIALSLIQSAGVPIATPSANISGKKSGTNIEQIKKDFGNKVDYYIDGGKSKLGVSSTIVQVVDDEIQILRQGSITKEQLEEVVIKYKNC